MATIISGYDDYGIRDAIYHTPAKAMETYLEDVFSDRGASRFSERFLSRAKDLYQKVTDSRLYRSTLASARRLRNLGSPDTIRQLTTMDELQCASPTMQRVIMANPNIRSRFRTNMLEGYLDTYDDPHPNAYKHTDRTYRQVMDGVVTTEKDQSYAYSYHLDKEARDEFSSADKADIRITWKAAERALWEQIEDPTSQYNAALV